MLVYFTKGFALCTFVISKNKVTLPHSAQNKHAFWGEINKIPKSKKIAPRKKDALELI